jgi:hypothetical protein
VSVQEESLDKCQEARGFGVCSYQNLSLEVGILMVVVFPLPRLIEGEAPLRLRFEWVQEINSGYFVCVGWSSEAGQWGF